MTEFCKVYSMLNNMKNKREHIYCYIMEKSLCTNYEKIFLSK